MALRLKAAEVGVHPPIGGIAFAIGDWVPIFKDACVMDSMQEQTTMELTARLQVISLGHQKREARLMLQKT